MRLVWVLKLGQTSLFVRHRLISRMPFEMFSWVHLLQPLVPVAFRFIKIQIGAQTAGHNSWIANAKPSNALQTHSIKHLRRNVFEFETVCSCLMPRMHYNLQKTLCCEHWAQYARYLDVHFAAFLIVVQAQKWVEKTKERKTWIEIRISLAPNVHFATKLASFGEGKTCSTLAQLLNSHPQLFNVNSDFVY